MSKAKDFTESFNVLEMANLRPGDTGLPVFVWVDEMGGYRKVPHSSPRLKIAMSSPKNIVVTVSIDNNPELLDGTLEGKELALVKQWIILNYDILSKHWKGEFSTRELFKEMQKIG